MTKQENKRFWKHPQYGMVYCGEMVTPQGQVCWPGGLSKPKDPPPPKDGEKAGQPRYEGTLILEKKHPAVIKFVKELEEITEEGLALFNDKRSAKMSISDIFGKYGDGDSWDLEKYPYYKGCWVLVARNAEQPKVVDNKRDPVEPGDIKGGMPCRFVITPLITAHGVSYKLLIVQKFEGEYAPIAGGARDVLDLLADLESEEKSPETVELPVKESVATKVKGKAKSDAVNLLA